MRCKTTSVTGSLQTIWIDSIPVSEPLSLTTSSSSAFSSSFSPLTLLVFCSQHTFHLVNVVPSVSVTSTSFVGIKITTGSILLRILPPLRLSLFSLYSLICSTLLLYFHCLRPLSSHLNIPTLLQPTITLPVYLVLSNEPSQNKNKKFVNSYKLPSSHPQPTLIYRHWHFFYISYQGNVDLPDSSVSILTETLSP